MSPKPHDVQFHVSGNARDADKAQEIIGTGEGFIACDRQPEPGGFRLAVRTAAADEATMRSLREEFRAPGYAVQKYPQQVPGRDGTKTDLIVIAPLI